VRSGTGDSRTCRWRIEENIIGAVIEASLEALTADPDNEQTGMRQRTLARRLRLDDKSFAARLTPDLSVVEVIHRNGSKSRGHAVSTHDRGLNAGT
jgi:hypothetical protein